MTAFSVQGGRQLRGEITPQGAKNEALQVICATLLTPEKITIHNIPDILDVNNLISLIASLGDACGIARRRKQDYARISRS